jgi:hypothetical protein
MTFPQSACILIATMLVAEFTGIVAALLATFRWRAAGLGVLVPALLLPGLVLFLACRSREQLERWSAFAYWAPNIVICAWLCWAWLSNGEGSDWAGYQLVILIPCVIVAYLIARVAVSAVAAWQPQS